MAQYIGAVDQGTTSSRFIIFDEAANIVGAARKEHKQILEQPGWVAHDPMEIWENTCEVMGQALANAGVTGSDLAAIGITNQRETAVVWDRQTGLPLSDAVVWQCTRSDRICKDLIKDGGQDRFKEKTGLPVATYFSGPKFKWIFDHVPEAQKAARLGRAMVGTIDSWMIWNLTGGKDGGTHVTDVTNASRTMLMNIHTLAWDQSLLDLLKVPSGCLPEIVPSSDQATWGTTLKTGPLKAEVPVCGALGDQQAALFGQACFAPGDAKNTYGTGCFLLMNTGKNPVFSSHGLLTTVGYQMGNQKPVYALEGSIAYAGALVQWLRDNLGLIKSARDIETLAGKEPDNGDVYCVPAFSGLFAPYWRSDARGVITGLTGFANKHHLARAVLESTAYQTRDMVDAMNLDAGVPLKALKVDGGMVENRLLMQFQADILNTAVIRPKVYETTALGAAYAAGLAVGYWKDLDAVKNNWRIHTTWQPQMSEKERHKKYSGWKKAVARTYNWVEE